MEEDICPVCKTRYVRVDGYCPNCGTLLHADTQDKTTRVGEGPHPHPPPDEPRTAELKNINLEYKHLYLQADRHGVIPFRLKNLGDHVIRRVMLHVESTAFFNIRKTLDVERTVNLRAGQSTEFRHCDFDINPKSGFFTVELRGCCFDETERVYAFRGSFSLVIRDHKDDKANLVIEEGYGVQAETIDMDAVKNITIKNGYGVDLGNLRSGDGKGDAAWIKVPLEEDMEWTDLIALFKKPQKDEPAPKPSFTAPPKTHARAYLELTETQQRIHIWTGRQCRVGRSPDKSDLVCMLLPNTGANRDSNLLISLRHFCLRCNRNRVSVEDQTSRNGTFLDGERITSKKDLKNGQAISLANVLSLRYHDFRSLNETREINRAFNKCRTVHDYTTMPSSLNLSEIREKAPIESFVLRRLDGFEKLEYLFLMRSATIGASHSVAVSIPHESLSPQHARIMLIKGVYYLEDLGSENGTRINGVRLTPSTPEFLPHGAAIKLGEVDMRFRIPAA